MSENRLAAGKCLDVAFYIDQKYKFVAPSLDISAKSFEELRDAIERKQKTKIATERAKLYIAAMWVEKSNVIDGIITGVHAGHGKLITKPALDSYKNSVFPRVGWLKIALAEKIGLQRRANHISNAIEEFEVEGYKSYAFSPEMHAGEIERISKAMDDSLKAAEKTDLEAMLKKKPYKEIKY